MAGTSGQDWLMEICGAVKMAQVEVTEALTARPQLLTPVTVETLVTEQLAGAR